MSAGGIHGPDAAVLWLCVIGLVHLIPPLEDVPIGLFPCRAFPETIVKIYVEQLIPSSVAGVLKPDFDWKIMRIAARVGPMHPRLVIFRAALPEEVAVAASIFQSRGQSRRVQEDAPRELFVGLQRHVIHAVVVSSDLPVVAARIPDHSAPISVWHVGQLLEAHRARL